MAAKINSTKIGDEFESKSLGIIRKVIADEQLGDLGKYMKIFPKKGYYSEDRRGDIQFDLTIEVWPPGATRYTLIYIIECKDYRKRVPVSKIEEFRDKIRQLGGINVKGIFISNSPLQKGGFNIAESCGMMVIEGESSEDYKIVLYKRNRNIAITRIGFINETFNPQLIDEGSELIERLIDKKIIGALQENNNESSVNYGLDKLSKNDIEKIANEELNNINTKILSEAFILDIRELKKYIQNELGISLFDIESRSDILGSCDIQTNTIGLNTKIKGTNRELFILAHELGHWILHPKLSIGQIEYELFEDAEFNFRTNRYELTNPKHWIEWQANYFATSFILPKVSVMVILHRVQGYLNQLGDKIYLDDQHQNVKNFMKITEKMAYLFGVSKTSVIFRLNEMNLIINKSKMRSLSEIIEELKAEMFL